MTALFWKYYLEDFLYSSVKETIWSVRLMIWRVKIELQMFFGFLPETCGVNKMISHRQKTSQHSTEGTFPHWITNVLTCFSGNLDSMIWHQGETVITLETFFKKHLICPTGLDFLSYFCCCSCDPHFSVSKKQQPWRSLTRNNKTLCHL